MYQIDFTTCTADDVIARSAVCHPSLFADRLKDTARVHITAYATMRLVDMTAANVASGMASDCNKMAEDLIDDPMAREDWSFGQRIIAFSIACRLQGLQHATAQDILSRTDTQTWAERKSGEG